MLAGFILLYSAVAGQLARSPLSGAMIFTAFGFIFGPHALGLLDLNARNETIRLLAELTLAIVLFVDAAHADKKVIENSAWILVRLLAVGLPLTIVAGFGIGSLLFEQLSPIEIALLATMLAPTDATLGKPVVENNSIRAKFRESLNFESGLNDGICVPF